MRGNARVSLAFAATIGSVMILCGRLALKALRCGAGVAIATAVLAGSAHAERITNPVA